MGTWEHKNQLRKSGSLRLVVNLKFFHGSIKEAYTQNKVENNGIYKGRLFFVFVHMLQLNEC